MSVVFLAASDDPGFLAGLLAQVVLWAKVAIGIGLVIFVHELGHFLAAKLFGVKCEKFYIGFDVPIRIGPIALPRTLGKFQYGETEYGIGILPLGGYVQMLGQNDDPRKAEEEAQKIKVNSDDPDAEPEFDPRSYPAKPVWQRMIIISAGVVVNVITGVLFAAMAFGYGIGYQPAVVGSMSPGGPAWAAGIQPGGRVVAVGDMESDAKLHFNEMSASIRMAGVESPDSPIHIRIRYGDEDRDYELQTQPHPVDGDLRMVGVSNAKAAQLAPNLAAFPGSAAASVLSDKENDATITAFDGQSLDLQSPAPVLPLQKAMLVKADQAITLTLASADDGTYDVSIPAQPTRTLGIHFKPGPITALIKDGPAETAGVKVGDVITAVDGNQDVDAFALVIRSSLASRLSGPVTLTLQRGEGDNAESVEIEITPSADLAGLVPVSASANEIASGPLGLAFKPLPIIAGQVQLNAADSEATEDDNAISPGDEIRSVRVRWKDNVTPKDLQDQLSPVAIGKLKEGWEFESSDSLISFMSILQLLPLETEFQVIARRQADDSVIESTMTTHDEDWFWFERGIAYQATSAIQKADSVGDALSLGIREGGRRMKEVFGFLGMLVRGKVKAKFVGGPIRIVQMAGMQAERGIPAQLMFLTMLSMNLAIVNFLPIPALDGGHMMFLTAELIRGKRLDEQLEMKLTMIGVLAILALMIFVFTNDIIHI